MTDLADRSLLNLSPAAARLGIAFARPKTIAIVCVVTLSGLGWVYLAGMHGTQSGWYDILCRPQTSSSWNIGSALVLFGMWSAMALAMMLPSAAPMIFTYAEIADTAAQKREPVISPFVLAAGYLAIWLAFALAAAFANIAFASAALFDPFTSEYATATGAIFIFAGVYQFSALKHACLHKCQRPFPFFFMHWATTARGVFRLGLKQGAFCLGCCWALMLVMMATGAMNVLWMAALGAVMTVEKMTRTRRFTYAVGGALIVLGFVFLGRVALGVGIE